MTPPYYRVVVTSLTNGWSYTSTHAVVPNPADPVHLLDPFKLNWQFEGEQIPGHLVPSSCSFKMLCRSGSVVPDVQVGDLLTIDVRIGTAGARIGQATMRVTSALVDLDDPADDFPVEVEVTAIATDVDWHELPVGQFYGTISLAAQAKRRFRERLAEVTRMVALSLGVPNTWANIDDPPVDGVNNLYPMADYSAQTYENQPLRDLLRKTLNSHFPGGNTHTVVTKVSAGYPAGYVWCGPAAGTWDHSNGGYLDLTDPVSAITLLAVPAGRRVPGAAGLPWVFGVSGGVVVLVPVQPPAGNPLTQLGISADWCILPTRARRARDRANSFVRMRFFHVSATAGEPPNGDGIYALAGDTSRGVVVVVRDVPSDLMSYRDTVYPINTAIPIAAAKFLSDSTALNGAWCYDSIKIIASTIPDTVAAWLLPRILPRVPGETDGDGCLVRHLTIANIDPDLRFADGGPATGFVTGGSLTIADGDMTFELNMTPGLPQLSSGAVTPVTVAEVQASGTYGVVTVANIDSQITLGDLDYVDS
jgi:hypothetical protein